MNEKSLYQKVVAYYGSEKEMADKLGYEVKYYISQCKKKGFSLQMSERIEKDTGGKFTIQQLRAYKPQEE